MQQSAVIDRMEPVMFVCVFEEALASVQAVLMQIMMTTSTPTSLLLYTAGMTSVDEECKYNDVSQQDMAA